MTSQTESQFQSAVIETAQLLGWLVAHFRPAQTQTGWRTPVAGDGAGFPDLVLVRDRTIFAELKKEGQKPGPKQRVWLDTLRSAGDEVYVWRPSDFADITKVLRDKHPPWPAWIPESLWQVNPP